MLITQPYDKGSRSSHKTDIRQKRQLDSDSDSDLCCTGSSDVPSPIKQKRKKLSQKLKEQSHNDGLANSSKVVQKGPTKLKDNNNYEILRQRLRERLMQGFKQNPMCDGTIHQPKDGKSIFEECFREDSVSCFPQSKRILGEDVIMACRAFRGLNVKLYMNSPENLSAEFAETGSAVRKVLQKLKQQHVVKECNLTYVEEKTVSEDQSWEQNAEALRQFLKEICAIYDELKKKKISRFKIPHFKLLKIKCLKSLLELLDQLLAEQRDTIKKLKADPCKIPRSHRSEITDFFNTQSINFNALKGYLTSILEIAEGQYCSPDYEEETEVAAEVRANPEQDFCSFEDEKVELEMVVPEETSNPKDLLQFLDKQLELQNRTVMDLKDDMCECCGSLAPKIRIFFVRMSQVVGKLKNELACTSTSVQEGTDEPKVYSYDEEDWDAKDDVIDNDDTSRILNALLRLVHLSHLLKIPCCKNEAT